MKPQTQYITRLFLKIRKRQVRYEASNMIYYMSFPKISKRQVSHEASSIIYYTPFPKNNEKASNAWLAPSRE